MLILNICIIKGIVICRWMLSTTTNCGYSFKKVFSNNYIGYHSDANIINICGVKSNRDKPPPNKSCRVSTDLRSFGRVLIGKSQLSKLTMRPMKVLFKDNLEPFVYDSPMGIVSVES